MIELTLGCARAVFTDRHGGTSAAPFDTMNLAGHVDDDAASVEENYRVLAATLDLIDASHWVRPFHVHGTDVIEVTNAPDARVDADGSATDVVGLPLVALGADCAPIALANDDAVAAIHAGWRGALGGVVESGVAALRRLGDGPVRAAIGPCICVHHYEFGADALTPLVSRFGSGVVGTTTDDRPAFDLPLALQRALDDAGVDEITDVRRCTFESPDHYSYRRDARTGRQGVVVVKSR